MTVSNEVVTVSSEISGARLTRHGMMISGHAYLSGRSNEQVGFEAVLRSVSGTDREYVFAASRTRTPDLVDEEGASLPDSGFDLEIVPGELADGTPLPSGIWELWLRVTVGEIRETVRLGVECTEKVRKERLVHVIGKGESAGPVVGYIARGKGFCLDVGGHVFPTEVLRRHVGVSWLPDRDACLRISIEKLPPGLEPSSISFRAEDGNGEYIIASPYRDSAEEKPSFILPLETAGEWKIALRVRQGEDAEEVHLPPAPSLIARRWRKGLTPWYARPLPAKKGVMGVRVAKVDVIQGLRRRLGN
ncbi:hypothetical protein FNQ90_01620 [Streptomyces alkaliphilus]|uniref:Uncharacterized protein n=1 Tax=Streptomyces alkaliphilus TaxID=1472722 RepID=A0A7W3T9Q9_9ACTN|nr:hypothetical protein [Streptomyces alkaliphilus]MBB0242836.1 hypothetical protein [Streptomyces alkaliphilus]